jgi:hypothetical protein
MKITLDIEEEININELIDLIKKFYPDKKINPAISKSNDSKIFSGIGDLEVLHIENFELYARDELYDR